MGWRLVGKVPFSGLAFKGGHATDDLWVFRGSEAVVGWQPTAKKLAWTYKFGNGSRIHPSLAVSDGVVFTVEYYGRDKPCVLVALDVASGRKRWRTELALHPLENGFAATPASLFVLGSDGERKLALIEVASQSGKILAIHRPKDALSARQSGERLVLCGHSGVFEWRGGAAHAISGDDVNEDSVAGSDLAVGVYDINDEKSEVALFDVVGGREVGRYTFERYIGMARPLALGGGRVLLTPTESACGVRLWSAGEDRLTWRHDTSASVRRVALVGDLVIGSVEKQPKLIALELATGNAVEAPPSEAEAPILFGNRDLLITSDGATLEAWALDQAAGAGR